MSDGLGPVTRRRARAGMALAAAGVIALSLVMAACDSDGGTSPAPASSTRAQATSSASAGSLPVGPASTVPWWSDGRLHVGDTSSPVARRPDLDYRGGTTVASFFSDGVTTYEVSRDGGALRPLPVQRGPASSLVISPDGSHLAWVETVSQTPASSAVDNTVTDERLLLVDYDLDAQRVVATLRRAATVECCDAGGLPQLQGITRDGRVITYTLSDDRPRLWDPTSGQLTTARVSTNGVEMDGVPAWPGGVAYEDSSSSDGPGGLARVSTSGHVTTTGRVPQATDGLWNDTGTSYAYDLFPHGVLVQSLHGGRPDQLRLPGASADWAVVAWESDTDLIVSRDVHRHPQEARCDLETSTCEAVPGLPPSGRVVLPSADD